MRISYEKAYASEPPLATLSCPRWVAQAATHAATVDAAGLQGQRLATASRVHFIYGAADCAAPLTAMAHARALHAARSMVVGGGGVSLSDSPTYMQNQLVRQSVNYKLQKRGPWPRASPRDTKPGHGSTRNHIV